MTGPPFSMQDRQGFLNSLVNAIERLFTYGLLVNNTKITNLKCWPDPKDEDALGF